MNASKKIVLYIDDNATNFRIVELALEGWPHVDLIGAAEGGEGFRLAKERLPHVILLDVHLPDVQGDVVLGMLKNDPATADIPVLVLSADSTSPQMRTMLAAGAVNYLTKPLDLERLLQALQVILHHSD